MLTGRDVAKLEQLAATLPAESASLAPYDLTQADGIPTWMLEMAEKKGPFAGIAHIAGVQVTKPLRMIDAAFVGSMFNLNVTSGIMLAKAFRQKVCHSDGASMVLLSASAAHKFGGSNVAYAASKGAVLAATRALAHELIRDKIRVNCVTPALVESDMAEKTRAVMPAESWAAILAEHPLGIGTPDDVAGAILYLLSDQTKWMTGTELRIDGGLSIV